MALDSGDPSSSSGDRIFNGVRFVLFGFDSVSEAQYRAELVRRGGTDVGKYDPSCTHVIVSGRVHDDPVCVAAREDGKILVTELWVDDSVDFGILADASRVLYRPMKDLNGIPGSESLYICLTGYQRQEREDVMKMVSLMGARFSKPLVANQVTHLICYKFEGEKYELAKKVKIKLVNHRWLEDCLKAWEILPVENYAKSGWELEVLEAEAKDSEDETEDPGTELLGQRTTRFPSRLRGETSVGASSHLCTPNKKTSVGASSHLCTPNKMSTTKQNASGTNLSHVAESHLADLRFSTPIKETCYNQNLDNKVEIGQQPAGSTVQISSRRNRGPITNVESPIPHDDDLHRTSNVFSSDVQTLKMDPTSSKLDERSTISCDIKSTPEKENPRPEPSKSFREDFNENISIGDLDIRMASRTDCKPNYIQSPAASSGLPQKRKVSDLSTYSKSPQFEGKGSKFSPQKPSANMENAQIHPTSAISINDCHAATHEPIEGVSKTNSKDKEHVVPSKYMTLSYRGSLKRDQPAPAAKHSKSPDSLLIGSAQNGQSKEALDQTLDITSQSVGKKDSSLVVPPSSDKELGDLSTYSKSPQFEGEGSKFSPQKPSTNMENAQLHPTSAISINYNHAATHDPIEGAAKTNSKDKEHVVPSKYMSLSYRRSLKRDQPAPAAKISKSADSLLIRSAQNGQFKGELAETLDATSQSVEKKDSSLVVPLSSDKELGDLPTDIEPKKALDVSEGFVKNGSGFDSLIINDQSSDPQPLKEKVLESFRGLEESESGAKSGNSGDIVMDDASKFMATGGGKPQERQQDGGATSSRSRESESRKLSSTASTSTCKDNGTKESFGIRMKKVVSRSNLRKPQLTAVNIRKDKVVSSPDKATAPEKPEAKSLKSKKINAEKEPEKAADNEDTWDLIPKDVIMEDDVMPKQHLCHEGSSKRKARDERDAFVDAGKENIPKQNGFSTLNIKSRTKGKVLCENSKNARQRDQTSSYARLAGREPVWFILSGHRFQRKEFKAVIGCLKGRVCRDSHNWSYQATHFIVPDPVRRTEKFFAAAAAGRWILKTDYLTASNEAGRFLDEEPFEWYRKCLTEDGTINLEAPRKWRQLREKTGHGALYGMRVLIYGECIAPTLDTLKRVIKAGDGTILATSPPYTRFLKSGVDFAIVSSSMPRVDSWVQEFLRHEIPCVVADYLVEYVCKPGYSLERHVLYNTLPWAEKSFANMLSRSEEIVTNDSTTSEERSNDMSCVVCGSGDRGEVMLICGDESDTVGCGIGTHIDCCDPPFDSIPEGDWFCPKCSKENEPKKSYKRKSTSRCK